jgi:hypothetical protein
MKIALVGMANSGKTTLFNALTGQHLPTSTYPTPLQGARLQHGQASVPDERLPGLAQLLRPKKTTPAKVHFVDFIGLRPGQAQENLQVLQFIKGADALVQVVRAFREPSVPGAVEPLQELQSLQLELILTDLELLEKRLERLQEARKKGKRPSEAELQALLKCKGHLEEGRPLRELRLSPEEEQALRHLELITFIPALVLFNVSEEALSSKETEAFVQAVPHSLALSAKLEAELSELEPPEQEAFLRELGLKEPASQRLIRAAYGLLGLITFFTYASQELRAWSIRAGATALQAAGKIHTDMARGFIRAEVINAEELLRAGGLKEARSQGLLRLEGKDYVVQDGDVLTIRFKV